jgi:hypothetical protein
MELAFLLALVVIVPSLFVAGAAGPRAVLSFWKHIGWLIVVGAVFALIMTPSILSGFWS